MKAVIQHKYGGPDTLQLVEIEKPECNDREMLIKVHASNIASGDMRVNTLTVPFLLKLLMRLIFGWSGPRSKVRGITAAGEVVEVGNSVKKYQIGDHVYFINSMKAGCLAEYISLKETAVIAKIPTNMSFVEASPLAFGALSAYHFINKQNIKPGNEVLVYGASGSVGSYAVQLAKHYGATVTAVCSKKNHEAVMSLGATHVIDYKENDFRKMSKQYDVIFDAVGKITKSSCKSVLKNKTKYLTVKMPTKEDVNRLEVVNEIVEKGELKTLLDTVYPVTRFKEAHEKTYSGHKLGNIVIDWNL